jgi:DNA-binding SARP family transcriptional activator
VRFRLLGPLEVRSGEDWSGISAAKQRALLAALLLHSGQAVSTERLIAYVWGDEPPAKATNLVSIYVLRLRKLIGDPEGKVLATRSPGYQLRLAPGDLDAALFAELVTEGRQALAARMPERASALLTEALGLWRGQPLADVQESALVEAETDRLEESRVEAEGLRITAELACGRAAGAVARLRRMIADHPLHEELWALLMRALNASGRQAEALETYEEARKAIAEELGVDPGAELQKLYRQILAADAHPAAQATPPEHARTQAETAAPAMTSGTAAASQVAEAPLPVVPSQLPADIPDFTGRGKHVKHLCDLFSDVTQGGEAGAVVVSLVAGTGGLGKTTLAVHAAHRLRAQFPDGQLYVNLLGASVQPPAAADVLARFLRELGVDGVQIPVSEEERAALYRTRLSGRRVLIVLDDAHDAAQVRPLLPGSASCGVLITSRKRLPDLAGVRLVDLQVLDDDEARTLLARIVGAKRLEAEPEATRQVLAACAGLPLAIRIAGARLATRASWTIQTLARRLADERRRIDELKVGDLAVRACFQVSFASLPTAGLGGVDPARAFRLLGLWHGPTIGLPAAAALLGEPEDDVADALEVLVDANLLQSPAADRYRFHDLLRVYAAEQAMEREPQQERDAAIRRLVTWYLHTAAAAAHVAESHRAQVELEPPPPGCHPLSFDSAGVAFDWGDTERVNLVASTRQAGEAGLDEIAWKLAVAAGGFLYRWSYWTDCIACNQIGLASARRIGDRTGEAWMLNNLGMVFGDQRLDEAIDYLKEALAIRREIGDRRGEAQTANNLAYSYQLRGRPGEAVGLLLGALDLQREIRYRYGESVTLSNLGEAYLDLGDVDEAMGHLQEALAIAREIHARPIEGYVLTNLGKAHLNRDRLGEAVRCLRQAVSIHHTAGDRYGEANDLKQLGNAERSAGQPVAARQAWSRAQAIFRELGDDGRAAEVSRELASLASRETGRK